MCARGIHGPGGLTGVATGILLTMTTVRVCSFSTGGAEYLIALVLVAEGLKGGQTRPTAASLALRVELLFCIATEVDNER